jgi:hypothetical protein
VAVLVRAVRNEFGQAAQGVVEVLGGHHVGQRQPDGGQLPGQELGVGLGPDRDLTVALDVGPVPVVLAVLGQQDQRGGVGGLRREGQVEQDERVGVPVLDQPDRVQDDPADHDDGLAGQEAAGAEEPGDALGHPAEGVGVVPVAHARCGAAGDGQISPVTQAVGREPWHRQPPLRRHPVGRR